MWVKKWFQNIKSRRKVASISILCLHTKFQKILKKGAKNEKYSDLAETWYDGRPNQGDNFPQIHKYQKRKSYERKTLKNGKKMVQQLKVIKVRKLFLRGFEGLSMKLYTSRDNIDRVIVNQKLKFFIGFLGGKKAQKQSRGTPGTPMTLRHRMSKNDKICHNFSSSSFNLIFEIKIKKNTLFICIETHLCINLNEPFNYIDIKINIK